MNKLDNQKLFQTLDPIGVAASIVNLGSQLSQATGEIAKIKLPADFKNFRQVVVNGMGGSALGPHIFATLFSEQLKIPYLIINSYQVPAYVGRDTLYILSSYSGTTEETLATYTAAKKAGAKIFGVTSGGPLAKLIKQKKIAGYVFEPKFNRCGQPRMGLGYSLGAQIGLFKKLGLISLKSTDWPNSLGELKRLESKFGLLNPTAKNPAKQLALKVYGKMPVVVAAEFLSGNAHALANQINENAKTFANYYLISELNHHLLESLKYPLSNKTNLAFILFESKLYYKKNQWRFTLTKDVVSKNKIPVFSYALGTDSKFKQALEMLVFGSYFSYYLAVLAKVNPSKIPWVDYFKAKLKKMS